MSYLYLDFSTALVWSSVYQRADAYSRDRAQPFTEEVLVSAA